MKYTIRFAHLKEKPNLKVNQIITSGNPIGTMGSTGQSTANHVHIDCIEFFNPAVYHLSDINKGLLTSAPEQLNHFIDKDLFKTDILITTYYNDPEYMGVFKKLHPGYDVVPENRHKTNKNHVLNWNRSCNGIILAVGFDKHYGNYINIGFER